MSVLIATAAAALLTGAAIAALAFRWPVIGAPRVRVQTVVGDGSPRAADAPGAPSPVTQALRHEPSPVPTTGVVLAASFLTLAGGVVVLGTILWMVRTNNGLARYDLSAARWGSDHATVESTRWLRNVSLLGGTAGSTVVGLVVASVAVAVRHLRLRGVLSFLIVVIGGATVLMNGIKVLVDRTRPDIGRLTGFAGSSFPSGHATISAAAFAAAALLLGTGLSRATRASLTGLAAGIAAAVAASRVFLGVHWLTDVLAGLVLGWTWFALVSVAFGGRLLRFAAPVEAAERVAAAEEPAPEDSRSQQRV